ncbi:MAG: LmeA family phospholipid-binding protein [Propionibacteriaceae bacterium]
MRALIALAVVAALLAAAVGIGDTAGRRYAEDRAAQAILQRSGLVSSVAITDQVFVLSLVRQRFDNVDVEFPAMPISARSRSLTPKVDINLTDVVATDGFSRFVATKATAVASLQWSQVSTLAGYTVSPDGSGIAIAVNYALYGIKVTGTVTATPAIKDGQLVLTNTALKVAGVDVPPAITSYLLAEVAAPVDLGLPKPFVATSLAVTKDALTITAVGNDVDVTALG